MGVAAVLFLAKVLRTFAFGAAASYLSGAKRHGSWLLAALALGLSAVGAMVWDYSAGTHQVTLPALDAVTIMIHMTGLAAALALAVWGLRSGSSRLTPAGARVMVLGMVAEIVCVSSLVIYPRLGSGPFGPMATPREKTLARETNVARAKVQLGLPQAVDLAWAMTVPAPGAAEAPEAPEANTGGWSDATLRNGVDQRLDPGTLAPQRLLTEAFLDGAMAAFLLMLAAMAVSERARRRRLRDVSEVRAALTVQLNESVQMLAGDVAKPLQMIRALLDEIVRSAARPEGLPRLVGRYGVEVERCLAQANAAVADVLEINAQKALDLQATPVQALVDTALRQVFFAKPRTWITFAYPFDSGLQVSVDGRKLVRVYAQLIDYAVEAMGGRGELKFDARPLGADPSRLELVVIGSGIRMSPDQQSRLFTAQDGGSLGMAICRRIIEAHGGAIRAESDPRFGLILRFTVPTAAARIEAVLAPLPRTSAELIGAATPEARHGTQPVVAVVDRDPFMLELWAQRLDGVACRTYASPEALLRDVEHGPELLASLKVVVTDMDFGTRSAQTGRDLAYRLRGLFSGRIVLASDTLPGTAGTDPFDLVLPKEPHALDVLLGLARPRRSALLPRSG